MFAEVGKFVCGLSFAIAAQGGLAHAADQLDCKELSTRRAIALCISNELGNYGSQTLKMHPEIGQPYSTALSQSRAYLDRMSKRCSNFSNAEVYSRGSAMTSASSVNDYIPHQTTWDYVARATTSVCQNLVVADVQRTISGIGDIRVIYGNSDQIKNVQRLVTSKPTSKFMETELRANSNRSIEFGVLGLPDPGKFDNQSTFEKISRIRRDENGLPMDNRPTHNSDEILEYDKNLRSAYYTIVITSPSSLNDRDHRWIRYVEAEIVDGACDAPFSDGISYCGGNVAKDAHAVVLRGFH